MPAARTKVRPAGAPEGTPLVDPAWTDGQKRIFESALSVFAEKGFAAATTGEIARQAGVAEALLFKYFGNKRSLLKTIALPVLEKWVAPISVKRLKEVLAHPGASPEAFLRSLIEERRKFFREHRPVARIVMQEAMVDAEIRLVLERTFSSHVYPVFRQAVLEFQKRGIIADFPPETIVRMIVSAVAGYILLTEFAAPDRPWAHAREIDDTIQILLYGLSGADRSAESDRFRHSPGRDLPGAKTTARRTKTSKAKGVRK